MVAEGKAITPMHNVMIKFVRREATQGKRNVNKAQRNDSCVGVALGAFAGEICLA